MKLDMRDGFAKNTPMSESMSELEITRMHIVLAYLSENDTINSAKVAEMLGVEIKTAGRLLPKAYKVGVFESEGRTKDKIYRKK